MDERRHFPLFQPHRLVSSQTLSLACTVGVPGCLLQLHVGCRMTGKGRFGTRREPPAHGCGWHITEPGELRLSLAPSLPPWDRFLTSCPVIWGAQRRCVDFALFISLTTGDPAVWPPFPPPWGLGGRGLGGWAHFKALPIKSMLQAHQTPGLRFAGRTWRGTKI